MSSVEIRWILVPLILGVMAAPALAQEAPAAAEKDEGKDDGEVRFRGQTLSQLIAELNSGDAKAKQHAAFALKRLGAKAVKAVPDLIKALGDESSVLRNLSAQALSSMGAAAEPELRKALGSSSAKQRAGAAHALELLGAAARPSAPVLIKGLADREAAVRRRCAEALGAIGANPAAIAPLASLCRDADAPTAKAAASALGRMGVKAGPAAVALLKEASPELRIRGLEALRLGAGDAASFDAVRALLKDKESTVRVAAALTMPRYKSAAAATALIEAGGEKGSNLSAACVTGLIRIGSAALKPLDKALKAKESAPRLLAVEALDQLCRVELGALPVLMRGLADKDKTVREECILALARVAQDLDELGDHKAPLRKAFQAILDKEEESDEALEAIEDALDSLGA